MMSDSQNPLPDDKTVSKRVDLDEALPDLPPRPHTSDFSQITIMLNGWRNPIFKFAGDSEIRIGRHVENETIRWNNFDLSSFDEKTRSVSRRHCRVYMDATKYYVEDMQSRNGTWLNGRRLQPQKSVQLKNRDYVQVGQVGFWLFLPKP